MGQNSYIEFPLEDGTFIVVEVPENEGYGSWRDPSGEGALAKAVNTLEQAIDKVKPAAEIVLSKFANLAERPTEIEIEFGLKLNAQVGAIIASGSVEANYVVKLKWKRSEKYVQDSTDTSKDTSNLD